MYCFSRGSFFVCFSYESMKSLCDRFNRAIDSMLQMVSIRYFSLVLADVWNIFKISLEILLNDFLYKRRNNGKKNDRFEKASSWSSGDLTYWKRVNQTNIDQSRRRESYSWNQYLFLILSVNPFVYLSYKINLVGTLNFS